MKEKLVHAIIIPKQKKILVFERKLDAIYEHVNWWKRHGVKYEHITERKLASYKSYNIVRGCK